MGEPPGRIDWEVDGNERLRRFYFNNAPRDYGDLTLGRAVAASVCVPGIFKPLSFPDLYKGRVVRLVDGGVFDNQGLNALLEENCDVVLVSDASGQMNTDNNPPDDSIKVLLRANAILMERVRQSQFKELEERKQQELLREFMFLHLKKDLEVRPVRWVGCREPSDDRITSGPPKTAAEFLTDYLVNEDIQRLLSNVRTDLDVFSDVEAYALMTSGYLMTEQWKSKSNPRGVPHGDWDFLRVIPLLKSPAPNADFETILKVASKKGLRYWRLKFPRLFSKGFKLSVGILGAVVLVVLVVFAFESALDTVTLRTNLLVATGTVLVLLFSRTRSWVLEFLLGTVGWLLARLHLRFIDPLYLRRGSIITEDEIFAWSKEHQERTGKWPTKSSGRVVAVSNAKTWKGVCRNLRRGECGLEKGSDLAQVIRKKVHERELNPNCP